MAKQGASVGPVVSAAHLAEGALPALSEIEFGAIVLVNAFQRWSVRCMAAAGYPGLTPVDVLVLHAANHRNREKTLADICMIYNIEDTHVVSYAVKKLQARGLVATGRRGKEKTVKVTREGEAACGQYRDLREALLVGPVKGLSLDEAEISHVAALMRGLSGQYDQAARAAAAM